MADDFTRSQVKYTDPKNYDQVIMVTQNTINKQLHNMWALEEESSKLRTLTTSNSGGSIDAKLEAPRIELNIKDSTKPIYYYLTFKSGTLKVYQSDDRADTSTRDFDVKGWTICFAAQISRKIVTGNETEFDVYTTKTGLKDCVFSLAKLYLDATSIPDPSIASTLPIPANSSYANVDWKNETTIVKSNFDTFMSRWVVDMGNAQKNVVGYSVLAGSTVNPHAPSFSPTAIDYCNYPWRDPSDYANLQTNKNDQDGVDQNAFSYLITTQKKEPPEARVLEYSAPFVNNAHGAVLCMNRELFWASWMLDHLRKLVRGTEMIPQKAYLEDVTAKYPDYASVVSTAPSFAFGTNPDHPNADDSYFALTDEGPEWSWSKYATPSTVSVDVPSTNSKRTVTETAQSAVQVTFVSGGQKIAITGSNSFRFHYSSSEGGHATLTTQTWWHLNFALGAVSDGGLQITRVADPTGVESVTTSHSFENDQLEWNYPFGDFAQAISDTLKRWFNNSLAWLTNDLVSALQHHHKLYLPASGVFLMQDAKFNKRGDLLVELHYNG
ncbi:uncharacterized protein CDV56_109356 [Aspergillus thermomutatus]|uniref:Uncharacterized protein n=1 Tax=Aspergillus thermomutatus TaxID=41047 RepID=A0A397I2U2_ASPTH|nr:uncharacterized protein CDV56_109356 [Aspergillus thermomutatus]RHZ67170.1 hypothetical protein CDV56_109356 [Aspergillus thermomutatus]